MLMWLSPQAPRTRTPRRPCTHRVRRRRRKRGRPSTRPGRASGPPSESRATSAPRVVRAAPAQSTSRRTAARPPKPPLSALRCRSHRSWLRRPSSERLKLRGRDPFGTGSVEGARKKIFAEDAVRREGVMSVEDPAPAVPVHPADTNEPPGSDVTHLLRDHGVPDVRLHGEECRAWIAEHLLVVVHVRAQLRPRLRRHDRDAEKNHGNHATFSLAPAGCCAHGATGALGASACSIGYGFVLPPST